MKVKFSRGPMNGKVEFADDNSRAFRVQVPIKERLRIEDYASYDPYVPINIREGEYVRSHRRLRDGTIIFEWMGWLDGKV